MVIYRKLWKGTDLKTLRSNADFRCPVFSSKKCRQESAYLFENRPSEKLTTTGHRMLLIPRPRLPSSTFGFPNPASSKAQVFIRGHHTHEPLEVFRRKSDIGVYHPNEAGGKIGKVALYSLPTVIQRSRLGGKPPLLARSLYDLNSPMVSGCLHSRYRRCVAGPIIDNDPPNGRNRLLCDTANDGLDIFLFVSGGSQKSVSGHFIQPTYISRKPISKLSRSQRSTSSHLFSSRKCHLLQQSPVQLEVIPSSLAMCREHQINQTRSRKSYQVGK